MISRTNHRKLMLQIVGFSCTWGQVKLPFGAFESENELLGDRILTLKPFSSALGQLYDVSLAGKSNITMVKYCFVTSIRFEI